MADDGWMAYHKVHQILKANTCNRGFFQSQLKNTKISLPLIKVIVSSCEPSYKFPEECPIGYVA